MSDAQTPVSVQLFSKEGGADKQYNLSLAQEAGGWVVNYANGKRNGPLKAGTKTKSPVSYDDAKKIFDRVLKEKVGKGYKPGEGSEMHVPERQGQDSGIRVQLLNPIEEDDLETYLTNDRYGMQEKWDGERRSLIVTGDEIMGSNRKGLIRGVSEDIALCAKAMKTDFVLDGEDMGDTLAAFDLLQIAGKDLRGLGFGHRYQELFKLLQASRVPGIHLVPLVTGEGAKRAYFKKLQDDNAEGVVFKDLHAPYTPGKPSSGGDQMKFKFYETASCIVSGVNSKRSVSLDLFEHGARILVGNVTIPPNHEVPTEGDIVEVRYLYAYLGGSLFQPVYLGKRGDLDLTDCDASQLKFKAETPAPSGFSF